MIVGLGLLSDRRKHLKRVGGRERHRCRCCPGPVGRNQQVKRLVPDQFLEPGGKPAQFEQIPRGEFCSRSLPVALCKAVVKALWGTDDLHLPEKERRRKESSLGRRGSRTPGSSGC